MIIPFKCDSVRVTSPYGMRTLDNSTEPHYGYDMVGVGSWDVVAVDGGVVAQSRIVESGKTAEWGNYVCIKTDSGQYHYYCHLASRAVTKGQRVKVGDKLGIMGATGKVQGAHLHFEVRLSDGYTAVNPESVLYITNKVGTYTNKPDVKRDLETLQKAGIINSPEYWENNADALEYQKKLYHNMAEFVRRTL